ncbi:MAG: hypothetical protein HDS68_03275 [Bacteroidales bacterium]|nr:hypothetical protein [Bacteroidales bacterium]
MKEKNSDILERAGHRDGMTVPEGFFDAFAERMQSALPENPAAERTAQVLPRSVWDRIRPFVYMAAMFAGIWCMLKMFTLMGDQHVDLSIDNNEILTEALSDDNFIYDHFVDDINQREIFDTMYDDSIGIEDIEILENDSILPN